MRVNEIIKLINGEIVTYTHLNQLNKEYTKAFACDLMSDCLAFINENCILITGLLNAQALRTAEMLDIDCIIFVRGKKPNKDMIELARLNHITLISSDLTMYEVSGILYQAGLSGIKLKVSV